ncbi:hypothetical protein AB0I53_37885 [Saccharopolyspora sp. NPDC050389]|uniref:hypothetical protein n=1 Tax=Saccharopolyspora sp. NPDC050389 TaxID=3155516 RepID=UPI0033C625AB
MPRRSPGALRAEQAVIAGIRPSGRIRGAGRGPWAELDRVEARRLYWLVLVSRPLDRYRRFLRQSGRWLYIPAYDSPANPVTARDALERAMPRLSPRARAELRRMLAPLDEEFRRCTIRHPRAPAMSEWNAEAWWRQRMEE